ncbi:unnamed protein product [Ixodes pacificus]
MEEITPVTWRDQWWMTHFSTWSMIRLFWLLHQLLTRAGSLQMVSR